MLYLQNKRSPWALVATISLLVATPLPVSRAQVTGEAKLSPAESALAVRALRTWFECEECEAGELAAVTKYGQAVVPSLGAVLNGGLSPATREEVRGQLEERYEQLAARSRKNPSVKFVSDKEQFITLYLDNRDAQYRVRAAQGLAAIGGQRARAELENGLRRRQRDDVRTVIQKSLAEMR